MPLRIRSAAVARWYSLIIIERLLIVTHASSLSVTSSSSSSSGLAVLSAVCQRVRLLQCTYVGLWRLRARNDSNFQAQLAAYEVLVFWPLYGGMVVSLLDTCHTYIAFTYNASEPSAAPQHSSYKMAAQGQNFLHACPHCCDMFGMEVITAKAQLLWAGHLMHI